MSNGLAYATPTTSGLRGLVRIWAVMVPLGLVAPAQAQTTTDKIGRLSDDQLSGKEARSIAQSLDMLPALQTLPWEQVAMLLAGLVQARAKFRYDRSTVRSLDTLALDVLKERDREGHILGKELSEIIENPFYLRREEAFRAALQFLLEARLQPSEFFDAIRILDPDELEDRDLIKRNADLARKFSMSWPHAPGEVSADLAEAVSALSGDWSQMSEERILGYVKAVGDVLGSSPVRSAADYATALEMVSRKPVLSAMAEMAGVWLGEGRYPAIVAFAASVHALVVSETAQDPSPQLKLIDEDQRVASFFAFLAASNKIEDLVAKETCEKAADDLFQQNPLAITERVMEIAQEQSAALVPDPSRLTLLAELYLYYVYQAQLSEMKAVKPSQIPTFAFQDPLSPAKVAKKLQVFGGLIPDDAKRLSPAVVTLQYYLRTGRIPEEVDFRRYVLVEAARSMPHLLLVALLDQWMARIGEWMSRQDLQPDEAKVFADWMFSAPLQGERLEEVYSFLFAASANFKEIDPAAVALRLSAADLLKNQDRGGATLADYLGRVLMARGEPQNLREAQDILKIFHDAGYLPHSARRVIRDLEFSDPETRALRELMVNEQFPSAPPTEAPSRPRASVAIPESA